MMMTCKKLRAIALTLALALSAAFCGFFMTACDNTGGNGGDNNKETKNTVSLAVDSVSDNGDGLSAYVINPTVNVPLTPVWSVVWENPASDWADGKTVSEYLKLDLSNGNLTATLSCLQPFGETAVVSATIGQGSLAVSASKRVDYSLVETYELSSDGSYYTVKKGRDADCYTVGILSEYNGLPVLKIGSSAFAYCKNLKSINIPDSIISIDDNAFSHCIFESIKIPDSVIDIRTAAFWSCSSLKTVYFNEASKLQIIYSNAFWCCTSLERIAFPASLIEIKATAFADCTSLKYVTFLGDKSNVKIVTGQYASFRDCPYQP